MTRRIRRGDDEGSLVLAMLVAFIGIAVVTMLMPIIVTQRTSTTTEDLHAAALSAAEAGLDAAFGQINAASSVVAGTRFGDATELPCGPLTGTTSAAAGANTGTYTVRVDYFATDPTGLYYDEATSTWHGLASIPSPISCSPGNGTDTTVPSYALLQSRGAQSAGSRIRKLVATYKFRQGNGNIPGGLVHVFKASGGNDLCIDAGSASPTAGTRVRMQPCTEGLAQQTFAYTPTLTFVLTSSKTASNPNGLCLDAGPVPHVLGAYLALQNCSATTQPRQQWSLTDLTTIAGTADGKTIDDYCFQVQSPNVPGSYLALGSGSNNNCPPVYNNATSWSPEATVGAGMAALGTGQLVNYKQFGRCLDVTQLDVNWGYLIAWPCKQSPDPSLLTWNQVWDTPDYAAGSTVTTGHITTVTNGTTYCLSSPLATGGQYVVVTPCAGASAAKTNWTMDGDTGTWATSYTIRDSAGYCLTPSTTDLFNPGADHIGKIVMAVCDGTALQKWNAPADAGTLLGNIGER